MDERTAARKSGLLAGASRKRLSPAGPYCAAGYASLAVYYSGLE
jgi:hypothetical protein